MDLGDLWSSFCLREVPLNFAILTFLFFINFLSHNCFAFSQFFAHVEEAEWAAEVLKSTGKPTAITLCIGPHGDKKNVSAGECAVRLARAGTVKQFSVAHMSETGRSSLWENKNLI